MMTQALSELAVYTTIDPERVFAAERGDEPSEVLHEKKRWVTALKLFQEAQRNGETFPLFLSDSRDCESLVFWARVRDMTVAEDGTYFTFSHLTGLRDRTTQDLVLMKEKRNIAPQFIRPYALVETPAFLDTHAMDATQRFDEVHRDVALRDPDEDGVQASHEIPSSQDAGSTARIDAPLRVVALETAHDAGHRGISAPKELRATTDAADSSVTLFSWGYFGWGSSLPQLLRVTERAEQARGFLAPVFVDVRFSRSVRSPGFRDRSFERAIGAGRYVWMKGLGNEGIGSGGLKIHKPETAVDLLDLAIREQRQGPRRVIFFCSCQSPEHCHRNEVRALLLDLARERRMKLRVVEWPGGDVALTHALSLDVEPHLFDKIVRDAPRIPITEDVALERCCALPWGSYRRRRASPVQLRRLVPSTLRRSRRGRGHD
jgi:hypothetical protein